MKIRFIAGLPRTGSTLLCNVLMQNDKMFATGTSALTSIYEPLKNGWDDIELHMQLCEHESRLKQKAVLKAVLMSYHQHHGKEIVFDKNRVWPGLFESLDWVLDGDVKIIVTVRNIRQIVESFEMKYRERLANGMVRQAKSVDLSTVESRANFWLSGKSTLGASYELLRDCVNRGNGNRLHFVRFEDLTVDPEGTINSIYEFIEEKPFKHDFKNVVQVIPEDDRLHGFTNLHKIRKEIKPVKMRYNLGAFGSKIDSQGLEFWNNDNV